MRHTLTIFWVGQPVGWVTLLLAGWAVSKSIGMSVFAYAASWMVATVLALVVWEREPARYPRLPAPPRGGPELVRRLAAPLGEAAGLTRFGLPRARAAVLSQLLFWTDYFVFSWYARGPELGVY